MNLETAPVPYAIRSAAGLATRQSRMTSRELSRPRSRAHAWRAGYSSGHADPPVRPICAFGFVTVV